MNTKVTHLLGVATVLSLGAMSHAAITDELPGNLFHQTGAPYDSNVSIATNVPQNMNGGGQVIGTFNVHGYPIGDGNSPIMDGDVTTGFGSGTFGVDQNDPSKGGMLNIALTKGAYNVGGGFTFSSFDEISTIRIWLAQSLQQDQSYYQRFATQVKVAYSMISGGLDPGNGYHYNSSTLGTTPSNWANTATIASVNGSAPTAPADSVYDMNDGWVNLDGTYITTPSGNPLKTYGYVDLQVNIPAGATSVMFSFGLVNSSTGNPGGMSIQEIQAIPEPASLGVLALGVVGLLARRRRVN